MRLRRRPRVARFGGLPVVIAAVTLLAASVGARPLGGGASRGGQGAPARLTVAAGDSGIFVPGRPVPVRVQVGAHRAPG